tara:strand:- start:503 stop:1189 length:687 start_codon:yes stop_codon:yes gene_type:complete
VTEASKAAPETPIWLMDLLAFAVGDCDVADLQDYDYSLNRTFLDTNVNDFDLTVRSDDARTVEVSVVGPLKNGMTMHFMRCWQVDPTGPQLKFLPEMSSHSYRPTNGGKIPTERDAIAADEGYALEVSKALENRDALKGVLLEHFCLSAIEEWRRAEIAARQFERETADERDQSEARALLVRADEARLLADDARDYLDSILRMAEAECPAVILPVMLDPKSGMIVRRQ